jgi:hypothetical protein
MSLQVVQDIEKQRRKLPNFIAVGVGRSGTTWLHRILAGHVGLPFRIKETDFFFRNYSKGIDWYESFFRHCVAHLPIAEICPTYFSSAQARERISMHIPDCKIICTFREPVERAYSHYKLMRHNVWTRVSFEEAIGKYREIIEMNRYAFHLNAWQETFGKENVLICLYDDLETDPQRYLDDVCKFIGIPRIPIDGSPAATERVNSFTHAPHNRRLAQNARHARDWLNAHRAFSVVKLLDRAGVWQFCSGGGEAFAPLEPEVEARLKQQFLPEVEALEHLIDRDLSKWKRPPQRRERSGNGHPPGQTAATEAAQVSAASSGNERA